MSTSRRAAGLLLMACLATVYLGGKCGNGNNGPEDPIGNFDIPTVVNCIFGDSWDNANKTPKMRIGVPGGTMPYGTKVVYYRAEFRPRLADTGLMVTKAWELTQGAAIRVPCSVVAYIHSKAPTVPLGEPGNTNSIVGEFHYRRKGVFMDPIQPGTWRLRMYYCEDGEWKRFQDPDTSRGDWTSPPFVISSVFNDQD